MATVRGTRGASLKAALQRRHTAAAIRLLGRAELLVPCPAPGCSEWIPAPVQDAAAAVLGGRSRMVCSGANCNFSCCSRCLEPYHYIGSCREAQALKVRAVPAHMYTPV